MASKAYSDQKRELKYTKGDIGRAGDRIRHGAVGEERDEAIKKIQNFREYHLYPLMLLKNHLSRTASKVSKKINVVRRLKQLATIVNKLERLTLDGETPNTIRVTGMQDIGGCRAIVKNATQLIELKSRLEKSSSVHEITKAYDYLTCPKDSGYGGIHLIYSCYKGHAEEHPWKGVKIEVQLRTELQHDWATSLEIIDTLKGMNLKMSHAGHDDWRRFFVVTGKLVAHDEKLCVLPPDELLCLEEGLTALEAKLKVTDELARFTLGIQFSHHENLPKSARTGNGMFLVTTVPVETTALKGKIMKIMITPFSSKQSDEALEALRVAELETSGTAVLVSAPDVRMLKKAYPNYFGSTKQFTQFINSHLIN